MEGESGSWQVERGEKLDGWVGGRGLGTTIEREGGGGGRGEGKVKLYQYVYCVYTKVKQNENTHTNTKVHYVCTIIYPFLLNTLFLHGFVCGRIGTASFSSASQTGSDVH